MASDGDGSTSKRAGRVAAVAAGLALLAVALQTVRLVQEADPAAAPPGSDAAAASADGAEPPGVDPPKRTDTYSNIYAYDYVGPDACRSCHVAIFETWRSHPHSRMNQNATAASVVGDFSDRELVYGDGRVVFSRHDGEYVMTLFQGSRRVRRLKVTRTVGSRFVQMYAGVQTEGPEPPEDAAHRVEVKLPFAYWIERRQWFPETYDENPNRREYDDAGALDRFYAFYGSPAKVEWKRVCVKCHNTYPYASRFGAVADGTLLGFPAADVSLDTPSGRRDAGELSEIEPWKLVTLGISCESCHFGGREHAQKGARISFLPRSEDLAFPKATAATVANARQDPWVVNSICSQCHSAHPQGRLYPNGAASWNSREAADLARGACSGAIKCTDCHDPHRAGPTSGGGPDRSEHAAACVRCHERLRAPDAAAAHGAHPSAAQVSCLDCHMPRVVHGLSGMIRTHLISSPTDARMLEGDWPNACNMCHLDRSARWTVAELAARWKAAPKSADGWAPSNDPLGPRWLAHGEPIVRQVAADAYSRSALGKAAFASVVGILNDQSPPNRMFGVLAVERLLGRRIEVAEYAPWAPPAERARQASLLSP